MGQHAAARGVAAWSTTRAPGTRSFGTFAVEALADVGVDLFDWQADVLDEWLEVDDEDRLTRQTAVLIVPRRNGKTALILARVLFGMMFLDERRVVFSAHMMDTAREAWAEFLRICQHPLIAPRVAHVSRAHGKEGVRFDDGSTFAIRTRTGHGGRGMEADLLILDEAMILDDDSVAALTPLTARAAAAGRGQVIYASSAGTLDSVVLARLRDRGRLVASASVDQAPAGDAARDAGLAYREFAAPRGADPDDPDTWHTANPSLGSPVLDAAFLGERPYPDDGRGVRP